MAYTNNFIHLLLFFLLFSCIISLPLSESLGIRKLGFGDSKHKVVGRQVMDVEKEEEMMMMKRMDLEINDYPGSGANNRHDPKTPTTP
ncbi:hypothetical protein IHE45_19G128400 [Dioscorea alata]|uniref:Uncharacterized protein n=1 Tax=Dioscorea alata TaxID=55571 RepID=A0ACB7U1N4_DIOAL|nr:hypothetical protein IHE45_19G128400 [Dioscorea alata]